MRCAQCSPPAALAASSSGRTSTSSSPAAGRAPEGRRLSTARHIQARRRPWSVCAQPRDVSTPCAVGVAVRGDEIPFLELDRRQDVAGCRDRVNRVANAAVPVPARGGEGRRRLQRSAEAEPHLAQPEDIEVVDEERAAEHGEPAGGAHRPQEAPAEGRFDAPDDPAGRLPLPEREQRSRARVDHVGAAPA